MIDHHHQGAALIDPLAHGGDLFVGERRVEGGFQLSALRWLSALAMTRIFPAFSDSLPNFSFDACTTYPSRRSRSAKL